MDSVIKGIPKRGSLKPSPPNVWCCFAGKLQQPFRAGCAAVRTVQVSSGTVRDHARNRPKDCSNGVGFLERLRGPQSKVSKFNTSDYGA